MTVREGELAQGAKVCAVAGEEGVRSLLRRSDFAGEDIRRLDGDGERVATGTLSD